MLAEHELAVVELQRVGEPRVGDGVALGDAGKLLEDRVDRREAQGADVGHGQAGGGEGVGHDRAVAAELLQLGDQLDVARPAGRVDDPLAERAERRQRVVTLGVVPLVDHGDDRVDEAVEADHHRRLADRGGKSPEALGGGLGDV